MRGAPGRGAREGKQCRAGSCGGVDHARYSERTSGESPLAQSGAMGGLRAQEGCQEPRSVDSLHLKAHLSDGV